LQKRPFLQDPTVVNRQRAQAENLVNGETPGLLESYMAIGRISGQLLKSNLLRAGENLAFETDLLYLDVVNSRIGIKTAAPTT
jgi:hypothetical protein